MKIFGINAWLFVALMFSICLFITFVSDPWVDKVLANAGIV